MWLFHKITQKGFEAEILFPEVADEGDFSLVIVRKKGREPVAQKEVPLLYPPNARQGKPKQMDVMVADNIADTLLKATIRREKKKREKKKILERSKGVTK